MTATERMYEKLAQQGKTSSSLCRFLNIKTSIIAGWKEQNTIPPAKYLVGISEFLNVSVDWLLTGEDRNVIIPPSPWQLTEEQARTASTYFPDLTEEQVALLNNFEKLDARDKREIKEIIRMKLGDTMGLSSSSEGHNGASGIA